MYRVHTYFLIRDSSVFREKLHYLRENPAGIGLSPMRPITLDETSTEEADSLFEFYYHEYVHHAIC